MFNKTTSLGVPIEKDPLTDFRKFLFVVWDHLNLPKPTDVQYDIAKYVQHGPKRSIIEAFRGVGKSWITSAYVVWLLYMNPQLNILVVSASKTRTNPSQPPKITLRSTIAGVVLQQLAQAKQSA